MGVLEEFSFDFLTGCVFGVTVFFVAYGCAVMFRAFKLPADNG